MFGTAPFGAVCVDQARAPMSLSSTSGLAENVRRRLGAIPQSMIPLYRSIAPSEILRLATSVIFANFCIDRWRHAMLKQRRRQ
jgi:hypothetical protein